MDPATFAAIGQIAQAILGVGIPAVRKIVEQFEKDELPTMEELMSLGDSMVKPEDFFKDEDASTD